jgi:hypothetical protein
MSLSLFLSFFCMQAAGVCGAEQDHPRADRSDCARGCQRGGGAGRCSGAAETELFFPQLEYRIDFMATICQDRLGANMNTFRRGRC